MPAWNRASASWGWGWGEVGGEMPLTLPSWGERSPWLGPWGGREPLGFTCNLSFHLTELRDGAGHGSNATEFSLFLLRVSWFSCINVSYLLNALRTFMVFRDFKWWLFVFIILASYGGFVGERIGGVSSHCDSRSAQLSLIFRVPYTYIYIFLVIDHTFLM